MPPRDAEPDPEYDLDGGREHDRASIERRLDAVERALSDDEPIERSDRLEDLESRVVELEAAVQALRGYVGSVRAVNEDVERQADRAYRKARAVERAVAPAGRTDRPDDATTPIKGDDPEARDAASGSESGASGALARFRHRL